MPGSLWYKTAVMSSNNQEGLAPAPRVVVGVTGSIAAYKAVELVSQLVRRGCAVQVVMTEDALRFVTEVPFKTLSQNEVVHDLYASDASWKPSHIALSDWADVVVVAPATANTIAKAACGIADNALTCLLLSLRPETGLLFAPAMNGRMWMHEATRENVQVLTGRGAEFVDPEEGVLACGYEGKGRMSPVETVLAKVIQMLEERGRRL